MLIYLLVIILNNNPVVLAVASEHRTEVACQEARKAVVVKAAKNISEDKPDITDSNIRCMAVLIEKDVL